MIKKKILIVSCLSVLLCTFILLGCLKTKDTGLNEKKTALHISINTNESYSAEIQIGDKTFTYNSEINNGKTQSNLKISNNNSILYDSRYELDTTLTDYRLIQHKKVEELAKSLKFGLAEIDYSLISSQIKTFLEDIFKSSNVRKRHVQSLFFHLATINTKLRAINDKDGVYECVPHPGYILGKSYFWCQEDYLVKTALIKDVFKNHPELLEDQKAKDLYNYTISTKMDYLPYDIIYSFNTTKEKYLKSLDNIVFRNSPKNFNQNSLQLAEASWCLLGEGSDWGCCGNYSGCCYYRSIDCYIHDRMCTDCEPRWFCFSGCVPD